jgi:Bacterial Ig domain
MRGARGGRSTAVSTMAIVVLTAAIAGAGPAIPGGGPAVAVAQTLGQGVAIEAPVGAATDPNAMLNAIACPAAGDCVAVGQYVDSSGIKQALVVTQVDGTWERAQEVKSPSQPASGPYGALLSSVACTAVGQCIAVGAYTDSSNDLRPMQVAQTSGAWSASSTAVGLPGDSATHPDAALVSVACPGAGSGSCVAVGYFQDDSASGGLRQMMSASGPVGGLGAAGKVAPPGNVAPEGSASWPSGSNFEGPLLTAVGCSDPGTCLAIGDYPISSGEILPLSAEGAATSTSEIATISQPAGQTSGQLGGLSAIACPGTGYCEAGGRGGDNDEAMVVSQAPNGVWKQETLIAPPEAGQRGAVQSLACPDFYSCIAVGNYAGAGFAASEQSGGVWGTAERVPAPAGGSNVDLWGVSCPPKDTSDCWGAGEYIEKSSSYQQAMVVQDSTSDNASGGAAPACEDVSVTTGENTPVTVELKCSEAGGAALTYAIDASPAHGALGTIEQVNGHVLYTPTAGYSGTDSFTYHASSTNGVAQAKTVSITITPSVGSGTGGAGGGAGGGGAGGGSGGGGAVAQATPHGAALLRLSFVGAAKRKPKLSFALVAASGAPALERVTVKLPHGLAFDGRKLGKGLSVTGAGTKQLKYAAHASGGTLAIALAVPSTQVELTLGGSAITLSAGEAVKLAHHKVKTLDLVIEVTDSGGGTTVLSKGIVGSRR